MICIVGVGDGVDVVAVVVGDGVANRVANGDGDGDGVVNPEESECCRSTGPAKPDSCSVI